MAFLQFTIKDLISDILLKMPEATDILLSHGLSCASCHLNIHEQLGNGVLSHGYKEKDLEIILNDLNEAAIDMKIPPEGKISKDPELTKLAAEKVKEFQKESNQIGFGFKIEVTPDIKGSANYFLDFIEKPERGDKIITTRKINLFLDRDSFILLKNCSIDYIIDEQKNEEGFKVLKKNILKGNKDASTHISRTISNNVTKNL